jgi:hypothetical protein
MLVAVASSSMVENNETNVGVYVNHLSSCNLNHGTGNMLCINQDFNTVIQYHDVTDVAMCPYHYCVLFKGRTQYSCTGYVLKLIGGKMNHYLNPLTPNISYVGFTGNPDDDVVNIGTTFLGYNVLVELFEQNVDNYSEKPIKSIKCMDPFSTHVYYEDGDSEMFGAHDIIFRGMIPSLLIGIVIHCAIAFMLYLVFFSFGKDNTCVNLCFVPTITFLSCFLILFVAEEFVVKIYTFIISSIFGVIIGYTLASIIFNSIIYCKRRRQGANDGGRVDVEETKQFVIGSSEDDDTDDEDDDKKDVQMVEIKLGEKDDDVQRI